MKAKKLQALLLAAVMVVSLAACGDTATTEKADDKTETKTETTTEITDEGSGEEAGVRSANPTHPQAVFELPSSVGTTQLLPGLHLLLLRDLTSRGSLAQDRGQWADGIQCRTLAVSASHSWFNSSSTSASNAPDSRNVTMWPARS